jgi:hypothetical protein
MLTKLRYQAKRHAISKMPRENKSCKFSPFFLKKKKKKKKNKLKQQAIWKRHHMQRQDQTCIRSMMPLQKNSRSTYFFYLPQKVPEQFSQET